MDVKKHISQAPTPDQTKSLLENIQKNNHKSAMPTSKNIPARAYDANNRATNNTHSKGEFDLSAYSIHVKAVLTIQRAYRRWAAKKILKQLVEEAKQSPESKRRCLRNQALKEIVVTERDYVSNLRTMLKLFYFPLSNRSQHQKPILNEQELKFIFANIEDIVKVSDRLYKKLYTQMRNISIKNPRKSDQATEILSIGDIFLEMIPMMDVYSIYMRNYDASIQKFVELLNSRPELKYYLEEVYNDDECAHKNLQFYLIMPVQRLPRYKMLLENLSNYSNIDHPDYQKIVKSMNMVDKVIFEINQRKRKEEELLAVQSSLIWGNEEEIDLLDNQDRDFIYDGQLFNEPQISSSSAKIMDLLKDKNGRQVLIDTRKKIGIKNFVKENFNTLEKRVKAVKSSSYHCFLFNDLFIRTIEKKNFKYKTLSVIKFETVIISSNPDPMQNVIQVKMNSHGIHEREITYLFYTQTTDDKEEWIKAFLKIPNAKYLEDNIYAGTTEQLYSKAIDTVKIGTLHLMIVEARSLPKRDPSKHDSSNTDTCTPYCVILVEGKQRSKTHTKKSTTNPKWNHNFELDVLKSMNETNLQVECFDFVEGISRKDNLMGRTSFLISDCFSYLEPNEQWHRLKSPSSSNDFCGEILLKIRYTPNVDSSQQRRRTTEVSSSSSIAYRETIF